jgi:hypothetical protein
MSFENDVDQAKSLNFIQLASVPPRYPKMMEDAAIIEQDDQLENTAKFSKPLLNNQSSSQDTVLVHSQQGSGGQRSNQSIQVNRMSTIEYQSDRIIQESNSFGSYK